jgi:Tfp pilus assembly protein PilZ
VGVSFPKDEKTILLKLKIEDVLGAVQMQSAKPTQTI